jgi:hypothetical protein
MVRAHAADRKNVALSGTAQFLEAGWRRRLELSASNLNCGKNHRDGASINLTFLYGRRKSHAV